MANEGAAVPMTAKKANEVVALGGGILSGLGPIILQILQGLLSGLLGGSGGICGNPTPTPTPTPADWHEFLTNPNPLQVNLQKMHLRQEMRQHGILPRSRQGVTLETITLHVKAGLTLAETTALVNENKPH